MTEIRRVEIRKSDIGRLIGKGGSTIKSLTSSYSVDIDIPKEDLDGDGKIDVSIEGSRANVEACLTKISQIVGYLPQPVDGASPASAIEHKDLDAVLIREVLFFPDPTEKSFQSFMSYIRSAKRSIDICVFTLSHQDIADYLLMAHKSGIKVRIVTDNDTIENQGNDCKALSRAGIPVHMDGLQGKGGSDAGGHEHGSASLMHHKYALLDSKVLMNGSFNFTRGASQNNSENVMVTNDNFFVATFQQHFDAVFQYFAQYKL